MTDHPDSLAIAAWQFNETVSLLREARQYVPEATGCAEDIDAGLPAIQEALEGLAAHREGSTAPAAGCGPECSEHHTFEPPCEAWIDSTGALNVPTPRGEPLPEQRVKVPPADLPADTPEPPRSHHEKIREEWGQEMADLVATPEGGQPSRDCDCCGGPMTLMERDPDVWACPPCGAIQQPPPETPADDELLDAYDLAASHPVEEAHMVDWEALAHDLASALRRKGERVTELEVLIEGCGCPAPFDQCTHDEPLLATMRRQERKIERLERELAEARDELATGAAEDGSIYQAGYQRGLIEARDHCSHVVTSDDGTSYCGLAERSHGEVLATHTTNLGAVKGLPLAPGWSVINRAIPVPPGTDVLVVRADQEATDGQ